MYNYSTWSLRSEIGNFNTDVDVHALLWTFVITASLFVAHWSYMEAPQRLRKLWKEYGPIVLDIILAFPLVRLTRRVHIYRCNLSIARKNHTSPILKLPDELILEICLQVSFDGFHSARAGSKCKGCPGSKSALVNLSKTNKRVRNVAALLLFRTAKMGQGRSWLRALRALKGLENSTRIMHAARTVEIVTYAGSSKGSRAPPKQFPMRLALVLTSFQALEKLILVVSEYHTETLRKAFEDKNVELSSVRSLVLGPRLQWLISMCPNVEVISTYHNRWRS